MLGPCSRCCRQADRSARFALPICRSSRRRGVQALLHRVAASRRKSRVSSFGRLLASLRVGGGLKPKPVHGPCGGSGFEGCEGSAFGVAPSIRPPVRSFVRAFGRSVLHHMRRSNSGEGWMVLVSDEPPDGAGLR